MISKGRGSDEKGRKNENFRLTLKMRRKCKRLKIEMSEYDVGFFFCPLLFQLGNLNIIMGEINLQQPWTALRA